MSNLKPLLCSFVLLLLALLLLRGAEAADPPSNGVYIVYMGSSRNSHLQLMTSLNEWLHGLRSSYDGGGGEVDSKNARSCICVPRSSLPTPHHSFVGFLGVPQYSGGEFHVTFKHGLVVLTILSTISPGIGPESASFDDTGMGPVPSEWKGKCVEGRNFSASSVICAAGNSGDLPMTVLNVAPWIVTVGATTVDRFLEAFIGRRYKFLEAQQLSGVSLDRWGVSEVRFEWGQ